MRELNKLKQELLIMKTNNIKPNYAELARIHNCDYRTAKARYKKEKNKEGIYELKEYKENSVPDKLKEKTNVNFEDTYYRSQLELYCNR